jgi:hypothetical protein
MHKRYQQVREQPSLAGVAPPPPEKPIRPVAKPLSGVSSVLREWEKENTENWF